MMLSTLPLDPPVTGAWGTGVGAGAAAVGTGVGSCDAIRLSEGIGVTLASGVGVIFVCCCGSGCIRADLCVVVDADLNGMACMLWLIKPILAVPRTTELNATTLNFTPYLLLINCCRDFRIYRYAANTNPF